MAELSGTRIASSFLISSAFSGIDNSKPSRCIRPDFEPHERTVLPAVIVIFIFLTHILAIAINKALVAPTTARLQNLDDGGLSSIVAWSALISTSLNPGPEIVQLP